MPDLASFDLLFSCKDIVPKFQKLDWFRGRREEEGLKGSGKEKTTLKEMLKNHF